MATIALQSAEILSSGTVLRLTFEAGSWSSPNIDLSDAYLIMERDGIDLADGFDIYRHIIDDTTTVLGSGKLQIDCNCTANDGSTDTTRNPIHDGFSNMRLLLPADAVTEGSDTNSVESDFSVTLTSVATGPVYENTSRMSPTKTYDPTDLASGSAPTGMAIQVSSTSIGRPGILVAAIDTTSLAVAGVSDPYMSGHFEWEVTDTSDSPITAYDLDAVTDPVFGGTLHPYTDFRGPELRCMVYEDETVRVKCTGYWKTASGEVSASAYQDITVRDIEWDNDVWVDSANGSSSNDGLDPWGFALTDAVYDSSTNTLTKAGAFTSYDHSAATAAAEPWKHYNFIKILSAEPSMLSGTPDDWLRNEVPAGETIGSEQLATWTNSGSSGTTYSSATALDIVAADFLATSSAQSARGEIITRSATPSWTSVTVGIAHESASGNELGAIYEVPGSFNIRQDGSTDTLEIDIEHGGGTETFLASEPKIGGFNGRKQVWVRLTEDAGGVIVEAWVNGTKVLDDTATATALLAPSGAPLWDTRAHNPLELAVFGSALTDAQIEQWEGRWAWISQFAQDDNGTGWVDELDASHPYKSASPFGIPATVSIASKTSNDAIVLGANTLPDMTSVASSTGPKDDGESLTGKSRIRIKNGSMLTTVPEASDIAQITPYGDGRFQVNMIGNADGVGQARSGSAILSLDHYVLSEADLVNTYIDFSASGNTGAGSSIKDQVLHNVRQSCVDEVGGGDKPLITSAPNGSSSNRNGISMLKSIVDAAGSTYVHLITGPGGEDGSGDPAAAPFGLGMQGSFLATNGGNSTLDHHLYNSGIREHEVLSLNRFGETGDGNYNLNSDAGGTNSGSADTPSKYVTYWRNEFSNALRGLDLSNSNNTRIERGGTNNPFESVVVTECSFHDLSQQAIYWFACNSARFAYCDFWDIGDRHIACGDSLSQIVAHNNYHVKESADSGAIVSLATTFSDDDTMSRKSSLRWQDDVIYDKRSQPEVLRCDVTKLAATVANGTAIGNITIYAPNNSAGNEIIYDTASSSYITIAAFESETGLSDTFSVVAAAPPAPTLSSSTPADGATDVSKATGVTGQASEDVIAGSGTAYIKRWDDDTTVASVAAGSLTINSGTEIAYFAGGTYSGEADGTRLYLEAPSGFVVSDATGLPMAAIAKGDWDWTLESSSSGSASTTRVAGGAVVARRVAKQRVSQGRAAR